MVNALAKRRLNLVLLASVFVAVVIGGQVWAGPKNVILFIGDGMGFEHVEAAGVYLEQPLCFESFPSMGQIMTYPADVTVITDSAAAGTALATGRKVLNGIVSSVEVAEDQWEALTTVLESYKEQGKRTGLVTTTYMTHATPATFAAHEDSRNNLDEIAIDYFAQEPLINVLFGGGENGLEDLLIPEYTVVYDWDDFLALNTSLEDFVSFQLGDGYLPYEYDEYDDTGEYPQYLSNMTAKALAMLDNDEDGFFLMVEGGRIDHACHDNDFDRMLDEMVEFNNAVQVGLDWVNDNDPEMLDTLILVAADHETGGLDYDALTGEASFSSKSHTDADVPAYAKGVNSELVYDTMDNTFMFTVVTTDGQPVNATDPYPADATINLDLDTILSWRPGSEATMQNVYFGTDIDALELVSTQEETEYNPGQLILNTTYYWRIDDGDVWNFATVPGALYVEDILMSYRMKGSWYVAQAAVTVDIDDDGQGGDIKGATVYGNWHYNASGQGGGSVIAEAEGVVNPSGKVTVESPRVKDGGLFTFEVTDIVKEGLVYWPDSNVETSDSIEIP